MATKHVWWALSLAAKVHWQAFILYVDCLMVSSRVGHIISLTWYRLPKDLDLRILDICIHNMLSVLVHLSTCSYAQAYIPPSFQGENQNLYTSSESSQKADMKADTGIIDILFTSLPSFISSPPEEIRKRLSNLWF